MAKKRKPVKPFFRQRGPTGRFLSRSEMSARLQEEAQRLADNVILSQTPKGREILARQKLRALRVSEVKKEKVERRDRYVSHRERYQWTSNPDKKTLADSEAIQNEYDYGLTIRLLPSPNDIRQHGDLYEYIWVWQGQYSYRTAQKFLLLAVRAGPADMRGYLALGNGFGKNSTWAGSHNGTPMEIWRQSSDLMRANSGTVKELYKKPQSEAENSVLLAVDSWAEVKLTTREKLDFKIPRKKSKKAKSKQTKTKKIGANKRKATKKKISRGNTKNSKANRRVARKRRTRR